MAMVRITRILGGYGRSRRSFRTAFPARIARILEAKRGDSLRWELDEAENTVTVTLFQSGTAGSKKPRPKSRTVSRQARHEKYEDPLRDETSELMPTIDELFPDTLEDLL